MAHRSSVPKFGDWESEGNYTDYFDKARKGRGSEKTNPSYPQNKPYILTSNSPHYQASVFPKQLEKRVQKRQTEPSSVAFHDDDHYCGRLRSNGNRTGRESQRVSEVPRSNNGQILSGEDGSQRRPYPLQDDTASDRNTMRRVAGSERFTRDSLLHPNPQARVGVKGSGVSSHAWQRKASTQNNNGNGFAPLTPGRPRPNKPDHSSAVPRFGDWDESNPTSGEAYTGIFNRVLQERQNGAVKVPFSENFQTQLHSKQKTKGCWRFPWSRK